MVRISHLSATSSILMWIMYFHFSISRNLFTLFGSFRSLAWQLHLNGEDCEDDGWLCKKRLEKETNVSKGNFHGPSNGYRLSEFNILLSICWCCATRKFQSTIATNWKIERKKNAYIFLIEINNEEWPQLQHKNRSKHHFENDYLLIYGHLSDWGVGQLNE